MTTRRDILKGGAGLAAILATGKAPAYLVRSMLAARQGIGRGGKRLPFDSEVEYLESTGMQLIDAGITTGEHGVRAVCEIEYTKLGSHDAVGAIFGCLVGGNTTGILNQLLTATWRSTYNSLQVRWQGGANQAAILSAPTITVGTRYTVDTSLVSGSIHLKVNGETFVQNASTINASAGGIGKIYINALSYPSSSEGVYPSMARAQLGWVRYYSFRLYNSDGVLVRDFQPVRFANELGQSEGAMYDRVSGELEPFRNRGTGAFVWGPDVSAGNGGGYNLICAKRSYRRSSWPSARCWRAAA